MLKMVCTYQNKCMVNIFLLEVYVLLIDHYILDRFYVDFYNVTNRAV